MDKFGIDKFSQTFHKLQNSQYHRLISNQFSGINERNETKKCINEMMMIVINEQAQSIAINLDYDNVRHYFYFMETFKEIFRPLDTEVAIYLNKIVELKEREDIDKILKLYHDGALGHVGSERLQKTLTRFFTWNGMSNDIKKYVKNCPTCEKTKTVRNTKIPMQITSLGEVAFDVVFCDFVGPIQPSSTGKKYIFTMTCDLTRMLIGIATEDSTALTAANCLLEHVILKYNFPSRLISDNATSFISQIIKELTKLFAIKKGLTCIYNPKANLVERSHRTLNAYLRAYCSKNKDNWDEMLKYATFAYNNSVQSSTQYTPHELVFGFKQEIPTHLTKPKLSYNYDNYADSVRNNIAKALEIARENLMNKKILNKKYYDENTKELDIKIGDLVLMKNQVKSHKFQPVYDGPFEVKNAEDAYVEIIKNGKHVKVHKNLIKKAEANYDNYN